MHTQNSPTNNQFIISKARGRKYKKFEIIFYILLFIAFSVSIIDFFLSKLVLFLVTFCLGLVFFLKKHKINNILYQFVFFALFIQIIAIFKFKQADFDIVLSTSLLITRIFLAFFILKLSGPNFLINFEKISFFFILIGLPVFFLIQFFPSINSLLSNFDLNTYDQQLEYGGWNILFFVNNGWAGFRFSGYAWEPGGMAMMITLSWIIYIFNNGTGISKKVLVYVIAMIFTFSTTGYFVLAIMIIFYMLNGKGSKALLRGFFLLILLGSAIPFVWQQEFMKDKISIYLENEEKIQETTSKHQGLDRQNVSRLGIITVGISDIIHWPLGFGTTTNGRTLNKFNEIVSGANGLMSFIIMWGIFGGIFLFYALYAFIFKNKYKSIVKYRFLLMMALILVFSSNPVSTNTVLLIVFFYPFVYSKKYLLMYENILQQQSLYFKKRDLI